MVKPMKVFRKVFSKIFAFVTPIVLIFIALLMLGRMMPSWSNIVVMVVGAIVLVVGLLGLLGAFLNIFKK